ncbi:DUF3331 domain-containing protein [Caballeronia udeis]
MLSENGSCHAAACPALPSTCHPSSYRPGHLASAHTGRDPWTTTLAAIHQFSSPPDLMRNPPDLSGRPRPDSEPFRPKKTDGGDARTFTVTVVEELSNSLFALCWHDSTLCNYEEQVWRPCPAPAPGRCALSGRYVKQGDPVYRPRVRGRVIPLNRDAMILASELIKAHTSA